MLHTLIGTKAVYAATSGSFGARVKFRRRKPSVLVALLVTLLKCRPESRSSVTVISKYIAEETFSKTWLFQIQGIIIDNLLNSGRNKRPPPPPPPHKRLKPAVVCQLKFDVKYGDVLVYSSYPSLNELSSPLQHAPIPSLPAFP